MVIPRLLVDALAAYRLTKLVTDDSLTEPLRAEYVRVVYAIADRPEPLDQGDGRELAELAMEDPDHPKWVELASCRWCAGMWVALGILVVRRYRWWPAMADALAMGAAAALVARLEE